MLTFFILLPWFLTLVATGVDHHLAKVQEGYRVDKSQIYINIDTDVGKMVWIPDKVEGIGKYGKGHDSPHNNE